jgi:hypothetical protein
MSKIYSIEDLIHLARLGRFGNAEMNALAMQAILALQKVSKENEILKKTLDDRDLKFYHVETGESGEVTSVGQ